MFHNNIGTLDICMKKFDAKMLLIKWQLCELRQSCFHG